MSTRKPKANRNRKIDLDDDQGAKVFYAHGREMACCDALAASLTEGAEAAATLLAVTELVVATKKRQLLERGAR